MDTMILDKTGTITYGNRLAADFFPVGRRQPQRPDRCAALTSLLTRPRKGKVHVGAGRRLGDTSRTGRI